MDLSTKDGASTASLVGSDLFVDYLQQLQSAMALLSQIKDEIDKLGEKLSQPLGKKSSAKDNSLQIIVNRLAQVEKSLSAVTKYPDLPDVQRQIRSIAQANCRNIATANKLKIQIFVAKQLEIEAKARGLNFERHSQGSDGLAVFRIGRFNVKADYALGSAKIAFARMLAGECELGPQVVELIDEKTKALERSDYVGPESSTNSSFLAELWRAYLLILARSNKSIGEVVDLAEVWPLVAALLAWKDRPYSRLQFAWDLERLWRFKQHKEYAGCRLNISAATMQKTDNKRLVFWLELGQQGQYYASLSFRKLDS